MPYRTVAIVGALVAGLSPAFAQTPVFQFDEGRGGYTVSGFTYEAAGQDKLTTLGAMTAPVPRSLATQLKLPAGMGLVVVAVDPNSPAAGALKMDDVLTKLDDQRLVDSNQLGVLVRSYKPGDEVTLTFLRSGAEATARVKLVERSAPSTTSRGTENVRLVTAVGPNGASFTRRADAGNDVNYTISMGSGSGSGSAGGVATTLATVGAGTATSRSSFTDANGTVELSTVDGKKSAIVRGPDGVEIFSGPFGTDAERAAAPVGARARIEEVEQKLVARQSVRR